MDIEELISLALRGLHQMFIPSRNLFCYSIEPGKGECQGISLRYSMISLIGLAKARLADYEVRLPVENTMTAIFERLRQITHIGDLGLFLWADALWEANYQQHIFDRVKQFSRQHLRRSSTMELAWILTGLSLSYATSLRTRGIESKEIRDYAQIITKLLKACFNERTGLFRYCCTPHLRRMLPNFASEIYPIYALSTYSSVFSDNYPLEIAERCAHKLCQLQGENGEWGWIYNEKHGTLVDMCPVYSVHQDSMAPMSLFALSYATKASFSDSIFKGLKWISGQNELGMNMVSHQGSIIYRAIYRQNPLIRYQNLLISLLGKTPSNPLKGGIKRIRHECRPYHLGWILEAWCGRTKEIQ